MKFLITRDGDAINMAHVERIYIHDFGSVFEVYAAVSHAKDVILAEFDSRQMAGIFVRDMLRLTGCVAIDVR